MAVKAKFFVNTIQRLAAGPGNPLEQVNVSLAPVYGRTGNDNVDWSKYTPNGAIQLTITNPAASSQFNLGQEFYITFDAAETTAQ